jgi:hypothetical protein
VEKMNISKITSINGEIFSVLFSDGANYYMDNGVLIAPIRYTNILKKYLSEEI